jgi:hypothetical protein
MEEKDKSFIEYVGQGFALGLGTIAAYGVGLLILALLTPARPSASYGPSIQPQSCQRL